MRPSGTNDGLPQLSSSTPSRHEEIPWLSSPLSRGVFIRSPTGSRDGPTMQPSARRTPALADFGKTSRLGSGTSAAFPFSLGLRVSGPSTRASWRRSAPGLVRHGRRPRPAPPPSDRLLRADIATWMQNPSQGPRTSFIQSDHPSDPTADWAILTGWLVAAREQISQEQARDADSWICDSLGIKHKDLVLQRCLP